MVALVVLGVISMVLGAIGAIGPARHHASAPRAVAPASGVARAGLVSALTTRDRGPDGTVVNPAMAAKVVRAFWRQHETALVSRDLAELRRLSAGPERRWEQASVRCGCVRVTAARPLLDASYFVARQTSFPASFVAMVKTAYPDGQQERQVLVFTKSAPGSAWLNTQMSLSAATPGTSVTLEKPVEDGSGYDEPATGEQHRRAQAIAARFAAMWQRAKSTGAVPDQTDFFITAKGRARLEELARYPQDQTQASGVLGHFRFYRARMDPLVEATTASGYELACQPIRETVQYHPQPGHVIVQDPAQRNWALPLAPGEYRQVTSRDVWQTCFMVPPNPADPVWVFFTDTGAAVATGKR